MTEGQKLLEAFRQRLEIQDCESSDTKLTLLQRTGPEETSLLSLAMEVAH
jgi:hypothetical protein